MKQIDRCRFATALVLMAAAFAAPASPTPAGHGAHWTYDGSDGPGNWGKLSPDYARCSSGRAQSPIDIVDGKPATLPGIGLQYPQSDLRIVNNGHTGQLNQATQQNASASEELAATAEEMGGQAQQLQELMAFFQLAGRHAPARQAAAARRQPKTVAISSATGA